MAKILLWCPLIGAKTGYGKQGLEIAKILKEGGHDVINFAFGGLQWREVEIEGIRCLPNNAADYGNTFLPIWNSLIKPDIIIQFFDLWVTGNLLSQIKDKVAPIYSLTPVDHDPCPPPLVESLKGATKIIAMTRFAERKFKEAGLTQPIIYIPHCVNTKIYTPGDRVEARRKMGNLPEDGCIFLSVATNKGPRKNLGNVLRAFAAFLNRVPEARKNAYLYLHCFIYGGERNKHGYNLPAIWKSLGIAPNIKCTHPDFYDAVGFSEEEMCLLYRAADWTILCSLGEGFGIPLIESMACQTPIIFSNFSATPEVVGPGGLPVDPAESMPFELSSSFQFIPSTEKITERFVEAYEDWKSGGKMRDELGKKGRQHVLKNYSIDVVAPKWLELVEVSREAPSPIMINRRVRHIPSEFRMTLIPTWRCNFAGAQKCIYCDYVPRRGGKEINVAQGLRTLKVAREAEPQEWLSFLQKLPPAIVDFTGGEPLLYSGITELLSNFPEKHKWALTTNIHRIEKLLGLDPGRCECITASYHPTQIEPYSDIDWFTRQLKKLRSEGFNTAVNIVGFPAYINRLGDYVNHFISQGFPVNVMPFLNRNWDWRRNKGFYESILQYHQFYNENQKFYWDEDTTPKICDAGTNYITVMPDGEAYRCYSSFLKGKQRMGNIFSDNFKLYDRPARCELPCIVPCDYTRPKRVILAPKVLVASLVGPHSPAILEKFLLALDLLDYPAEQLRFAFISHKNFVSRLEKWAKQTNRNCWLQQEPPIEGTTIERLCQYRRLLVEQALRDEDYVLWIDSDIVETSPNLLKSLVAEKAAIAAPMVAIEHWESKWFDFRCFRRNGKMFSPEPPYCGGFQPNRTIEIDSAGTCYLVKSDVFKSISYAYDGDSEHIAFCRRVKEAGRKIVLNPKVRVLHAYLPAYGEQFHHYQELMQVERGLQKGT